MVNIRYSVSPKKLKKQNKQNIKKIKNEFKKIAKENNINLMKLDTIIIGVETLYNPYKYKSFNRWVKK